jgi:hypothetical protein
MKYKIKNFADILNAVPPDKIKTCMTELAEAMVISANLCALARWANPGLSGKSNTEIAPWPDELEWIDSGLGVVTFKAVDTSGEAFLEIKSTIAKTPEGS